MSASWGKPIFKWETGFNTSPTVIVENERLLFTTGQAGIADDGTLPETFAEQTRQLFENLARRLEADGASLETIIKTTVYLVRSEDFPQFVEIRREFLKPPFPVSTGLVVSGFSVPEMLIELDAIALCSLGR